MDPIMPSFYDFWVMIVDNGKEKFIMRQLLKDPDNRAFELVPVNEQVPDSVLLQSNNHAYFWAVQLRMSYPDCEVSAYLAHAYSDYLRSEITWAELQSYKLNILSYKEVISKVETELARREKNQMQEAYNEPEKKYQQ